MSRKIVSAIVLTLISIGLCSLACNIQPVEAGNNRAVDLYTQKGGMEANQPSDAFASQEEVVLLAYVTYRNIPVSGRIVAFKVNGPANRFEILSFDRTAVTNHVGLAEVSFRVPSQDGYREEMLFGVWNVIASVDIAEVEVADALTFEVEHLVDSADLFTLAAAYASNQGTPLYNAKCDLDADGDVDSIDLFTLATNYGKPC